MNQPFPQPNRAPNFGESQTPSESMPSGLGPTKRMIPIPAGLKDVNPSSAIPAGKYAAALDNIEEGYSQAGNPKLVFTYKIIDGQFTGRKFSSHVSIQENTMWKLRQHFDALAVDLERSGVDTSDLVGTLVILSLNVRDYNGSDTNDVVNVAEWPNEPGLKVSSGQLPGR